MADYLNTCRMPRWSDPESGRVDDSYSDVHASNGYGASPNPYGGTSMPAPAALQHETSGCLKASAFSQPTATTTARTVPQTSNAAPLSRLDFLTCLDSTKSRIAQLTTSIQEIANIHERMLSSPSSQSTAQLESVVSKAQNRNREIKDEIQFLECDAGREAGDLYKKGQVESLKRTFRSQLEDLQHKEAAYSRRYRETIGRQYRIVNPEATDQEMLEVQNANASSEGIFAQALKTNRAGQADSVLSAVRARHDGIQRIERTLGELAVLFQQLNEQVVYQDEDVAQIDQGAAHVVQETEKANEELSDAIRSGWNWRRYQWYTLGVVVAIIAILAIALAVWFSDPKHR